MAQGTNCSTASPFCTAQGTATFPASQNTVAPTGPNYGCLASQPNPAWYYLQIATPGNLTLNMTNSANVDIDYIIWGPFTTPAAACASGLTGADVDCSYSSSANETGIIPSAVVGEVYVLLITNYSNQATTISVAQTGGSGATNCNIVCAMTALTAVPGLCTSPSNNYDVTGTITYTAPPTSGTLNITSSCGSATQIINAPFNATSATYTLNNLTSNGAACVVTATFSADPTCTFTANYTAPAACFVECPIMVDSARVCDGLPATISATGATSYLWSTGATTSSITVTATGPSTAYTVIGTTATCADTATSLVTTFPHPTVSFSADSLSGCDTVLVHFKADTTGNAGASYAWNLGEGANGVGMLTSHLYTTVGCHTITLTSSFGPGCSTTQSDSCMITVFPPPVAIFSVTPNEIDIISPLAGFVNNSINSTNWLWKFGDASNSILQNPDHSYDSVGTYHVTLYASSLHGCMDSTTNPVVIRDVISCYVPNSFTPNKNDRNETFNIYSYGVSADNFELLIFNRWGKQIFKTNDLHEGWNGAINNVGDVVETAVYVYHLNYKELSGKKRSLVGLVSLIK